MSKERWAEWLEEIAQAKATTGLTDLDYLKSNMIPLLTAALEDILLYLYEKEP